MAIDSIGWFSPSQMPPPWMLQLNLCRTGPWGPGLEELGDRFGKQELAGEFLRNFVECSIFILYRKPVKNNILSRIMSYELSIPESLLRFLKGHIFQLS